jgi:hypothetical protein
MNLTTAADLAAQFGIDEAKLHRLRVRNNWPHVKFGRNDVRFTDAQVEQIVALQSQTAKPKAKVVGQTKRSAARTS